MPFTSRNFHLAPTGYAYSFGPPHHAQIPAVLRIVAKTIRPDLSLEQAAHIVSCYSYLREFNIPSWENLPPPDKYILYSAAGVALDINYALTFDISNEQREAWCRGDGNVTRGFKRRVLDPVRRTLGGDLTYWLAVEPKVTKRPDVFHYNDTPNKPRCFDVHMALKLDEPRTSAGVPPWKTTMSRVQWCIWRNTHKLPSTIVKPPRQEPYPLFLRSRFGRMNVLWEHREDGWRRYAFKVVRPTMQCHSDVTGDRPFGCSNNLVRLARAHYEHVRREARALPPDPHRLDEIERHWLVECALNPYPGNYSWSRACRDVVLQKVRKPPFWPATHRLLGAT